MKPGGVNEAPGRSWVVPAHRSKYLMTKETLPRYTDENLMSTSSLQLPPI